MSVETMLESARGEIEAGRLRQAGRIVLDAVDEVRTPEQCDAIAELCDEAVTEAGFFNRGRFQSARAIAVERRDRLVTRV